MKAIVLITSWLAFATASASAGSFNVTWDQCAASGGTVSTFLGCGAGGVRDIIVTMRPDVAVPAFAGVEAVVEITANEALTDWWQFSNGACNASALFALATRPTGSTCPTPWGAGGANRFIVVNPVEGDPRRARVYVWVFRASATPLDAGTEYFAFRLRLSNFSSEMCTGCEQPVAISVLNLTLLQGTVCTGDPKVDLVLDEPITSGCIAANWTDCDLPTSLGLVRVSPSSCGSLGPTPLTLNGNGFAPGMTARLVRTGEPAIDGIDLVVQNPWRLDAMFDLGAAAPGPWDVEVTHPTEGTVTLPSAFQVAAELGGVSPNHSVNLGDVSVDITGCGFAPGAVATLTRDGESDIVAFSTQVVTGSSIVATFQFSGQAPGPWNVVVTSPFGHSVSSVDGFELEQAPAGVGIPAHALSLAGVVPNPARGDGFTVSFTLPDERSAAIEVIDVLGRRVAHRSVGQLGAGAHRVDLARNTQLRPGVYTVRLTRGSDVLSRRAVFVR